MGLKRQPCPPQNQQPTQKWCPSLKHTPRLQGGRPSPPVHGDCGVVLWEVLLVVLMRLLGLLAQLLHLPGLLHLLELLLSSGGVFVRFKALVSWSDVSRGCVQLKPI